MISCLTGARFNMKADVLRSETTTNTNPVDPNAGEWKTKQDPDSGEIIRVWVPADNPDTPTDESGGTQETFWCEARGIVDGGIRVAGTTERFSDVYFAADYVRITFPPTVTLSRRDKVTNIRDKNDHVIWREEERTDMAPTVFSVTGVSPIIDPFGNHIENVALLERDEVQ